MDDLLGYTAIAVVSLITLLLALRWPAISKILYTALAIRIFVMLLGHYVITLPDSTADANTFEFMAWTHSLRDINLIDHQNFSSLLKYYEGPSAHFISFFYGIFYYFLGRSILLLQSISLLFGIGCIFLGWKLAIILWDNRIANKVGWTMALFPSLILYSVLTMREVYVSFFLLVALYGVVKWVKTDNLISFFLAMAGFIGGIFFHGSIFVGAIAFVLIVGLRNLKKIYVSPLRYRFNYKIFTVLLLFTFLLVSYLTNKINVPYLGNFEKSSNVIKLLHKTTINTRGTASWPAWLKINYPSETFYKLPVRAIYFMFAPFPWDVKKKSHLIGVFDSFLYMYLVYLIFCNRKAIWRDPALTIILIILMVYIFVFAIGVGNFGTGIRHRSKFVMILILLAAPLIKKFIFKKKTDKI